MKKFRTYFYFIAFFSTLILSCQCEKSLEGIEINHYGNKGRTNSYEEFGTFFYQSVYTDFPATDDSSGIATPPLCTSIENLLVCTTEGNIIYFDRQKEIWKFELEDGDIAASPFCADKMHNFYFITRKGKIISLDINGKLRWESVIEINTSEIIIFTTPLAIDNGVVFGISDGRILKFSFDGKLDWSFKSSLEPLDNFPAGDSKIYVPFTSNDFDSPDSLVIIDFKGKLIQTTGYENTRFIKMAAFKGDRLYFPAIKGSAGNYLNYIICLDTLGKLKWENELRMLGRYISVANNGNVYIAGFNAGVAEPMSGMYSFDKDGKKLWDNFFFGTIPVPLLISETMIAFVARNNNAFGVYLMGRDGKVNKVISLADNEIINLQPAVSPEGCIIFGGAEKTCFIRIDNTPINKMLPY